MKRFSTPGRRALLVCTALLALASGPALADPCPQAKIDGSKNVSLFDYTQTQNGWVRTTQTLGSSNSKPSTGGTFQWTRVSGAQITLTNANTPTVTVTVPDVGPLGESAVLRLTVTGPGGNCSGSDFEEVNINIKDTVIAPNQAPHAVASASPSSSTEGQLVTLNGGSSSDPDNNPLTYSWAQVGTGPVVVLANSSQAQASFLAPNVAATTTLTFRLTVSDGSLQNSADTLVNVQWTNDAPTAVLSCPLDVNERASVTLNGNASSDSDGGIVSYRWQQLDGLPLVSGVSAWNTASVTLNTPSLGFQQTGLVRFQLTVTDTNSASSSATCWVFIHDITPPIISGAQDRTIEATSAAGATVNLGTSAFDAVDGDLSFLLACTPPSGLFPFGATNVGCSVKDSAQNPASAAFKVTVADTIAPVITAPLSVGVEATGPGGAAVTFAATTTDAVDGAGNATCVPASGSNFVVGDSTVACNATDSHGNAATPVNIAIHVLDTTAPTLTLPSPMTLEATSTAGAVATFSVSANDIVDGSNAPATCDRNSGETFALGTTTVNCQATDSHNNKGTGSFTVTVQDKTAPTIDMHDDVTEEATSALGASVNFQSPATHDIVEGVGTATCAPASGSQFAFGDSTVTCSANDGAGNAAAPVTFTVHVVDTTAPTIATPGDVGPIEATGAYGAMIFYNSPATSDAVDGPGTASCLPVSPSIFGLGSDLVTCTAKDAHNNAALPVTFSVTVVDTTPPTIEPHADIANIEATGPNGAPVSYTSPATHDLVDGDGTASCAPASGSTFVLGTTPVTCSATDAHSNPASPVTFTVTVVDKTPPTIDPHADIPGVEATGPNGAPVDYASPATHDIVDGVGAATCAPTSGSTFGLGNNLVTCNAKDAHGNMADPVTFTITVVDTTEPTLSVPTEVVEEATSAAGASVTFAATAVDLVWGNVDVSCVPPSGSTFAITSTPVNCSATDGSNNTGHASFTVTVRDTIAPVVTPPADVTTEATSPLTTVTHDDATATDAVGVVLITSDAPTQFPVGITTITWSAKDAAGNTGTATSTVTVTDTTAPAVSVPATIVREATSASGAVASFSASAVDLVDGNVGTTCAPASGSTFALGSTTVTCSATDGHNNTGHASFTVTVVDTTEPTVSVPANILTEAASAAGSVVTFTASASDLVWGAVTTTCSPASGSTFAIQATTVTCSATDGSGNTGTASFTVTVQDKTAPQIYYSGDVSAFAGSNSSAVVTYTQPTAWDIVDGAVTVNCSPASGSTFPVGTNTVACSATDNHGNTASGSFKVNVSYAWNGFFRPVDMAPMLNSSKAGSAIPLKFGLGGNQGMAIMAAGYPKSAPMTCGGALEDPLLETVTAGQSSLQYDASANQYIYVWKSEKSWAGTCRQIQVKLSDGSVHTANFSFK